MATPVRYKKVIIGCLQSYEPLTVPMHISTPMSDSIVVDHVYGSFIVTFQEYDNQAGVIVLDMVNFDIILSTLVVPHHAVLNFLIKTIILAMHGIPKVL